ncbi:MAG: C10 family peptidase [Bacteroidales bacterium]|nr:C10 family peptidase [Bacteroidales bacterium]
MKKIFLFLSLFSCVSWISFANPVDLNTAKKVAENFFYAKAGFNSLPAGKSAYVVSHEIKITGETKYYLFNFGLNGFVIVAYDDSNFPIIGFSVDEPFDIQNIPPALTWWLSKQSEECKYKYDNSQLQNNMDAWQYLLNGQNFKSGHSKGISPLLTCKWDQGTNYNYHCPSHPSGPGGHCYAGCVATAMAQIMYYYKFPEHGIGSYFYNHGGYGNIGADFESTYYDWASMTNTINTASKEASSILIYHCGVSVNMNYSSASSGANSQDVAQALETYFNFSPRSRYAEKDNYQNDEWNRMLIDNLEMQQPIYYSGSGPDGGHAFVFDGYLDSCYFHVNWGWGGYSNGYFYVSNLNSSGGNFSYNQAAVLDAVPYFYPYCIGKKVFTEDSRVFNDGSKYSYYWNDTDCEWLIAPETSSNIMLTFTSFDTEEGHDILNIYDGENASAPLLGTFSGHNIPESITTTGNRCFLKFTTDNATQDLGWDAIYVTQTSGIKDYDDYDKKINCYPNPASDKLNIYLPEEIFDIQCTINNIIGEHFDCAFSIQQNNLLVLNTESLHAGYYFIQISGSNRTYNVSFIVQK